VRVGADGYIRINGVKVCRIEIADGQPVLSFPDRNTSRVEAQGQPTCSVGDMITELLKAQTRAMLEPLSACERDSDEPDA
jgi:hypothetical protein